MREYFAKIVENNGKKVAIRVPSSAHDLEWFSKHGFLPFAGIEEPMPKRRTIATTPVVIDGEIVVARIYEGMTVADYDSAMEAYLRDVRVERGYTTREPDTYLHSAVERWAQDAKDWIAFKDAVMVYALTIINEYKASGNAPTLTEFKANLPKMVWTYQEEI